MRSQEGLQLSARSSGHGLQVFRVFVDQLGEQRPVGKEWLQVMNHSHVLFPFAINVLQDHF